LRFKALLILSTLCFSGFAQENKDTIRIREVIITDQMLFNPEQAGMQVRTTDSIVLQNKQGQALSELLSENTSVYIKNFSYGSLATASFRGTAASHTRVEWNELPINSPMLGMVDFSLIPVNLIDEISIHEGSSSITQSSGGLGGAIELKNKANWSNRLSLEYTQGIGSFHNDREYFKLETGNRTFQSKTRIFRISALNDFTFINKSIGEIDPISGEIIHPLDTNTNGGFFSHGIMQEFYKQINERNIVSLQYWGQKSERNLPRISSYEGPDNSSVNSYHEESHRVAFSWKRFTGISHSSYNAAFEYLDILYTLDNEVPGLGVVPVNNSGSNSLRFLQSISHLRTLTENTEYSVELHHQYIVVSSMDTVSLQGYQKSINTISLRNSLFRSFGKKVNAALIIRSELHGENTRPLIPFLGIDYKPSDSLPLVLKLSAASNFHFPELNDLYWTPGGNPHLEPEHGISIEGGLHYFYKRKKLTIEPVLSVWQSNISNWIIWLPSVQGYWEPQNISEVKTNGIQLCIKAAYDHSNFRLLANVNYSFGNSLNMGDTTTWGSEAYGKQLSFIPKQAANAFVQASWKGFFINYSHNHYGERFTSSSNEPGRRFVFYPYFMNNIALGKKLNYQNFQAIAELKVNNLFNETYHSLLIQPMPERNFLFMLRLKYTLPCKN